MAKPEKKLALSRFQVGDKVRVKSGVMDPDYPDMPLGGWTGTITEISEHEGQINCVFEVDKRTLASIHPVYEQRCEIDGLDFGEMGLSQDEIELDDGTLVAIEQPTAIVPRPLSPDDEDDRIRMALGLTHDDLIPDVNHETLLTYHRYLEAHLKFPIPITSWVKTGPFTSKKITTAITHLAQPQEGGTDDEYGLIAKSRGPKGEEIEFPLDDIEVGKENPNRTLLSDYSCWFQNWR